MIEDYIRTQIHSLNSGHFNTDDVLYRIGTHANIIPQMKGYKDMTESDKEKIQDFIREFKERR